MTAKRLIVVEDEKNLANAISDNLELEGFAVEIIDHGTRALERIRESAPSLVLLDVMLPGLDGFSICEQLRAEDNQVPILFLTAKSENDDRVRGMQAGGDDFLTKPFDLRELILRVHAILRRTRWYDAPSEAGNQLVLGETTIDFAGFTVRTKDREVSLSSKETMILRFLAEHSGEVVSRADIIDRVWGYDAFPTTRTIDNFIVRLRRVIEPDARNPRFIHTIRGIGYRLTP
jgi:two-component system alkaline phosphatase synthesis response regulator PhoP